MAHELARAEACDLFGRRWPKVLKATSALQHFGIYYYDATPGNIRFGDEDEKDD